MFFQFLFFVQLMPDSCNKRKGSLTYFVEIAQKRPPMQILQFPCLLSGNLIYCREYQLLVLDPVIDRKLLFQIVVLRHTHPLYQY